MKLLQGATALWPFYLPCVQLMYNNKVRELTGSTPFALMFGRKLNECIDYSNVVAEPITEDNWMAHQEAIVSLILPSINARTNERKSKQRIALDKKRKKLVTDDLAKESVVMILDPLYLANPAMRPVTMPKFIGPYTIEKRKMNGPYILIDATGTRLEREINIDQMKVLFKAGDKAIRGPVDPNEPSYVVEEILDDRFEDEAQEYKVKWQDYDVSESTWEPIDQFDDYTCIERYWRKKTRLKDEEKKKQKRGASSSVLFYTRP